MCVLSKDGTTEMGAREFGVFGIRGVWGRCMVWKGWKLKAPHLGIFTSKVVHSPHYYSRRVELAHLRGESKAGLFELEDWCVLQNLVPYVWELIFTQVPIKWRVISWMYIALMFLVTPCDSLWSCYGGQWGMGPSDVPSACPKSSPRFSYIFFQTVYMWAFEFVNYSALL